MKGRFIFLGTGASAGVPLIGCNCSVCTSLSSYNKRLRTSALIEIDQNKILIDIGPDFRQQALRHKLTSIDALFLTHFHSDHIAGIDDLRVFYFRTKAPIDCFLSKETLEDLKIRYYYLFKPVKDNQTVSASLNFHVLEKDFGTFSCVGHLFSFMSFSQGGVKVTGFRIGNLAYLSDIKEYPEEIFKALKGVKTLIISALKYEWSPVHFNIKEALFFAEKVNPEMTYLTHISHELEHEKVNHELPDKIKLAYDGQELEFSED